jgi:hypothetical protein
MIRIPHVLVHNLLLTPKNRKVQRLIVAHPKSVQYIEHDHEAAELSIKYVTGEKMIIRDKEDPEYIKKMFDGLVVQINDASD